MNMKKYTTDDLISEGYKIYNMKITDVDLSMQDYGYISMYLTLEGRGTNVVYGGYCLGHGYLGAKEFDGSPKSMEYIMRIMDTIGVEKFLDLNGKYCRIASKGWGSSVKIIGNIIENKWFDADTFFKNEER